MKCDLHIHTIHSGMCTVPVANRFCRESYNQPEAVYQRLKALGMDLVTITDHDSVESCESLRRYPDFFLSEEITCKLPSGNEAHLGVYDIHERQHVAIQKRRDDFAALLSYLHEQRLLFSVNHLFSGLTGRREIADYDCFDRVAACMETRNGAMISRVNRLASDHARRLRKSAIGGSDAHTMAGVGSAYTLVRGARTKQEFLDGIRHGRSQPMGESGSYWKLTRDVALICFEMMRERPLTAVLSPLLAAVPVVLLVNYWLEVAFAERWYLRATGRPAGPLPEASWRAGEAAI